MLTIYFLWIAYDPMAGSFLDMVDLPIHETGHLLFRILGEFIGIAGGSLFQVVVPAIFVGYFIWHYKYYSAAIVLFWVGQSILNVYVYAQDAATMQLETTNGFHDWNYMLTSLGMIDHTKTVAGLIRMVGTLTITAAAVSSIYYAFQPAVEEFEEI